MLLPETDTIAPTDAAAPTEGAAPDAGGVADAVPPSEAETKTDAGLIDVVRDALKPETPKGEAAGDKPADPAAQAAGTEAQVETVESLTAKLAEATGQIESYRAAAEDHGKVLEFCRTHGLNNEDVVAGFQTMALMARDPAKAIPVLENFIQQLKAKTGDALPDDLRQEVEQGLISQGRAKELALARVRSRDLESQARAGDQRWAEQRQAETQRAMNEATSAWFAETAARDPDLTKLRPLLAQRMQVIAINEGVPTTAAGARALADRALRELRADLAPLVPQRRPSAPTPSTTGAASGRREPTSMLDAVRIGLAS